MILSWSLRGAWLLFSLWLVDQNMFAIDGDPVVARTIPLR